MGFYRCDDCNGEGWRFVWRWPFFVKCEARKGDGHSRPPRMERPPVPPPPPPRKREACSICHRVHVTEEQRQLGHLAGNSTSWNVAKAQEEFAHYMHSRKTEPEYVI